jgi:hypothetical protein
MKKRSMIHTGVCWLIATGAAGILGVASAQDDSNAKEPISHVVAGTDYLQTGPNTQATLPIGGQMVTVTFQGVPIVGTKGGTTGTLGNTDTVVQRDADAVFPTGTTTGGPIKIPITMTALNMAGTVLGPTGATCTVTLTLAPAPPSSGFLYLTTNAANTGGGYRSEVLVHFVATFTPGTPTCYPPITGSCKFAQKGGKWSIKYKPGEFLVTGPYGDINANLHKPLAPGFVDFFISKPQTDVARTAAHATCEAFQQAGEPCPTPTTEVEIEKQQ